MRLFLNSSFMRHSVFVVYFQKDFKDFTFHIEIDKIYEILLVRFRVLIELWSDLKLQE